MGCIWIKRIEIYLEIKVFIFGLVYRIMKFLNMFSGVLFLFCFVGVRYIEYVVELSNWYLVFYYC